MTRTSTFITTAALIGALATAAGAQTYPTTYATAPATQDRVETILTSLTIGNPADLVYRP